MGARGPDVEVTGLRFLSHVLREEESGSGTLRSAQQTAEVAC